VNELQMCYQNSNLMQTSHIVEVPAGLFAVVIESAEHCPVTDAILHNPRRSIVRLVGTRRIAEHIARKLNDARDEYDECNYDVFPRSRPQRPPVDIMDDMPF
jgi:hypothetical protein